MSWQLPLTLRYVVLYCHNWIATQQSSQNGSPFESLNRCIRVLNYTLRSVTQTTLKALFGAFRPHFLAVCQPDPAKLRTLFSFAPEGFPGPVWTPVSACRGRGDDIRAAMQSFPSGHTATASTVGVFLALYLNAKLKAFSDYQTSYWKMFVVLSPLLGAGCVAGLLVIDGVRADIVIACHRCPSQG